MVKFELLKRPCGGGGWDGRAHMEVYVAYYTHITCHITFSLNRRVSLVQR